MRYRARAEQERVAKTLSTTGESEFKKLRFSSENGDSPVRSGKLRSGKFRSGKFRSRKFRSGKLRSGKLRMSSGSQPERKEKHA